MKHKLLKIKDNKDDSFSTREKVEFAFLVLTAVFLGAAVVAFIIACFMLGAKQ